MDKDNNEIKTLADALKIVKNEYPNYSTFDKINMAVAMMPKGYFNP